MATSDVVPDRVNARHDKDCTTTEAEGNQPTDGVVNFGTPVSGADEIRPLSARELKSGARLMGPQTGLKPGHINFSAVSKKFRRINSQTKTYQTIKSGLLSLLKRSRHAASSAADDIHAQVALSEFSLDIPPGTALGIIGRNGSGKSTLLKLIAGIYHPDRGRVSVSGKISALIELGAGFHPDFTGRENIYLGGVMYGLKRKEIDRLFDRIVSYAELAEVIDQPVRTYSSGMYMRLGFSLAVHTDPDILLIDEVLAVGDAAFVTRCHDTISEFKRRGKTLILVSHDMTAVRRWCDEVLWLQKGHVIDRGEPKFVVDHYLLKVGAEHEQQLAEFNRVHGLEPESATQTGELIVDEHVSGEDADLDRWGTGEVKIDAVRLSVSGESQGQWIFDTDDSVSIEVDFSIQSPVDDLVFGIGLIRADGTAIHGTNTDIDACSLSALQTVTGVAADGSRSGLCYLPQKGTYRFHIDRLGLPEDTYFIDVAAHRNDGVAYDYHHLRHKFAVRCGKAYHGVYVPKHTWEIVVSSATVSQTAVTRDDTSIRTLPRAAGQE